MTIDLLYFLLVVFAIFKGFSRGLIIGVFSVLAFVVGLAAALKLSAVVADHLQQSTDTPGPWLPVLSFLLVFIVVVAIINLLARLIDKAFDVVLLGWVDRLGGIVLYLVLYTLLFSIMLFFAAKTGLVQPATLEASATYPYVHPWGPVVMNNLGKLIPLFKDVFQHLENFFDRLARRAAT